MPGQGQRDAAAAAGRRRWATAISTWSARTTVRDAEPERRGGSLHRRDRDAHAGRRGEHVGSGGRRHRRRRRRRSGVRLPLLPAASTGTTAPATSPTSRRRTWPGAQPGTVRASRSSTWMGTATATCSSVSGTTQAMLYRNDAAPATSPT
jgi:hypothetical protein